MPYARLDDRRVLRVEGEAAEAFLQNLVTSDLDGLAAGEVRPSALLTPQGKILFDFLVARDDGTILLDVAATAVAELIKRLTLYRLRAKVVFEASEDAVFAVWDQSATEGLRDRRFAEDSVWRVYGSAPDGIPEASAEAFAALRIRTGIAEAERDFPASDVFPHDVLLDQNGGVSFTKGCYVGQEVVSRMQHRGTARRRIVLLAAEGHLTPGANIVAGDRPVGMVLAADASDGMGLVRIDRLAAALLSGETLSAGGVPLDATIPPWAGYTLPIAAEPLAAGASE